MDKIKFGIIGCGRIAQRHAGHIANFGELVSLHDVKVEKAKILSDSYQGIAYSKTEEFMNSNMDVVAVCSPNGLHAAHTIQALKAGYHVICEKPMAISSSDCAEMIQTADQANKKLFVVKQNRYNPAIAVMKEKLDAGDLGRIYSVQLNCFWNRNFDYYTKSDWKGTDKLDGGTLFTQFSHFIDLLYWMVGDIEEMNGMKANFAHKEVIDFEDTGVLSLKFTSGALGTINYTVNSHAKNMEGSITFFGEKGTVKIGGQYLNKLDYQSWEGEEIGELPPGNPANQYGEYQGSMSNHDKVYQNVVEVLQNNGEIATTGDEGMKVVAMIERMYQTMN
ncbi:MAG: Gfo/Idh/MocA family oxidoreductase [Cytophagales bacterium]|nr:Gfo/Idh/MocA family oxidoreductase [Cytophagales bacterium]